MRSPTDIEKAWMAGFLDGEGCITITFSKPAYKQPFGRYNLDITLTQNYGNGLDIFVDVYGGSLCDKDNRNTHCLRWKCPANQRERFLLDMLPFLRVKHQQALLALEFIKIGPMLTVSRRRSLAKENIIKREQRRHIYEQMKPLNQTGPSRTNLRLVV